MSFFLLEFFKSYEYLYICDVFMPMLFPEAMGGGDRHINNGVFLRFGFDCSKSWKTIKLMSKTKQRRIASGVLYLYSPCYTRWPMVYPYDRRNEYFGNDIFISA